MEYLENFNYILENIDNKNYNKSLEEENFYYNISVINFEEVK